MTTALSKNVPPAHGGHAWCGRLWARLANRATASQLLTMARVRPAVLVIVTDPESSQAQRATRAVIVASPQAGERIAVLSYRGGAVLASSMAPAPLTSRVSGPPAPLPASPTSFQKARYSQAVDHYRAMVRSARQALQERQRAGAGVMGTVFRYRGGPPGALTGRREREPRRCAGCGRCGILQPPAGGRDF